MGETGAEDDGAHHSVAALHVQRFLDGLPSRMVVLETRVLRFPLEFFQASDWKQWIPVYGIRRILKDAEEGKPSLVQWDGNRLRFCVGMLYHAASLTALAGGIVYFGWKAAQGY